MKKASDSNSNTNLTGEIFAIILIAAILCVASKLLLGYISGLVVIIPAIHAYRTYKKYKGKSVSSDNQNSKTQDNKES